MIGKELNKMNRRELVDIIYQMKKNEQRMQEKIASLEAALQDKRLRISEAGSIAEAAVSITKVFSAAQEAADLYLHEITCMKAETEKQCAKMLKEARRKADKPSPDEEKMPLQTKTERQNRNVKPKHLRGEERLRKNGHT